MASWQPDTDFTQKSFRRLIAAAPGDSLTGSIKPEWNLRVPTVYLWSVE
nr:hypothetical protein Itr_chr02CG19640 [Ipomoea trifida]GMC58609.1 hypothetical protein Iba_chr02aCG16910 [Ipomoea batatas]GME14378.1 hypothetical protein Iba_scaffold15180CG0010 [Ipomoea batatas]GME17835.1 hypothetical protein Iba_scaffold19491CG0440 [Ipomoea batatas]